MSEDDSTRNLDPTGDLNSEPPSAPSGSSGAPDSDARHGRFLPGTLFGRRYRIVALLGKGGMGEVYRADDLQLGQTVALKFLPQDATRDEGAVARLRNEVRVAREVSHPNVCRVYDIGEADGQYFLSMEYVDGEDLASVLRRMGRPSEEKALQISRQLCAGLAAAHESGVLHRDLKPANVMIDGRGRVRITDFGLAGFAEELSGQKERAGTPAYMAPEQFTNEAITARTDLYSLGLVLYELLTARRAYKASSLEELKKLHDSGAPSTPSSVVRDIDPTIERVVLRCLERDPARRPTSALAVAAALPGGDPLAAALAAGETPSPEMVAAAGGRGGLRLPTAGACLAAVLAGLVGVALLNDHVALFRVSPLPKPPSVLAYRARWILKRLGCKDDPGDACYRFRVYGAYLAEIRKTDESPARWRQLGVGRPSAYQFHYRQSPRLLVPSNTFGRVDWTDPPPIVPGMASLVLDATGRLLMFRVVPPEQHASAATRPTDFSALFARADLDPKSLRPAQPLWSPPSHCDEHSAWTGPHPGRADWTIRVEAGACRGWPVYFRVIDPCHKTRAPPRPDDRTTLGRGVDLIGVVPVLMLLVFALLVARYNLRQGRGDRSGAFRLGAFMFLLGALAWAFGADHVAQLRGEFDMLERGLGMAVVSGIWCGLAYLALEPYVRRLWPNLLISWTRLLSGKVRDRLVGRSVLVGGVAGVVWALVVQLGLLVPAWLHLPTGPPHTPPARVFEGGRGVLAQLFVGDFLMSSLYCLFLLMGLLALTRRRWVAVVLAWGLLTVLASASNVARIADPVDATEVAVVGLCLALVYFVLIRFGLLAVVAAWFSRDCLLRLAITLDTSAWYADTSLLTLALLLGLAVYGFRTATLRRGPAAIAAPEA